MDNYVASILKNSLTEFPIKKPGGLKAATAMPVHYAVDLPISADIFGKETLDFVRLDNYVSGIATTPSCRFLSSQSSWEEQCKSYCLRGLDRPPSSPLCDFRSCKMCVPQIAVASTILISVMDVKTEPNDFGGEANYESLVGHFNYYVMTKELFQFALQENLIPKGIGAIVLTGRGFKIKLRAMYRQIPRPVQSYLLRAFGEAKKGGLAV